MRQAAAWPAEPFVLPWLMLASDWAAQAWGWNPQAPLRTIQAQIAEEHPDSLRAAEDWFPNAGRLALHSGQFRSLDHLSGIITPLPTDPGLCAALGPVYQPFLP